jgi:hypothetical protein
MLRSQAVVRSCRFRVVLGDSSLRYPQFGPGRFKLRASCLPSVRAPSGRLALRMNATLLQVKELDSAWQALMTP